MEYEDLLCAFLEQLIVAGPDKVAHIDGDLPWWVKRALTEGTLVQDSHGGIGIPPIKYDLSGWVSTPMSKKKHGPGKRKKKHGPGKRKKKGRKK
jgi:hypothetical protein